MSITEVGQSMTGTRDVIFKPVYSTESEDSSESRFDLIDCADSGTGIAHYSFQSSQPSIHSSDLVPIVRSLKRTKQPKVVIAR